ncbi:MAG: hypothetical protein VYD19_07245 [Myxococcota bacterium]|nr:hypothetical protein [Myxococcota bacterium]
MKHLPYPPAKGLRAARRLGYVLLASLSLAMSVSLLSATVYAQDAESTDVTCSVDEGWPCGAQATRATIKRVNPTFKVQLRVSQSQNFIVEGLFEEVLAILSTPQGGRCEERFTNVYVRQSVLNIELGRNMNCELDRFIRDHDNLSLQLCLGGEETCFTVPIASVPYAVKANSARRAELAGKVNRVRQAHYAHQLASDRTALTETETLGEGTLDFHTPPEELLLDEALGYAPGELAETLNTEGGFIRWSPVFGSAVSRLVIALQRVGTNGVDLLNELTLWTERLRMNGALTVAASPNSAGPSPANNVTVTGHSLFQKAPIPLVDLIDPDPSSERVTMDQDLQIEEGELFVTETALFEGHLQVDGTSNVRNGAQIGEDVEITDGTVVHGELQAGPQWIANSRTHVQADGQLAGNLTVSGDTHINDSLIGSSAVIAGESRVEEGRSSLIAGAVLDESIKVVDALDGESVVRLSHRERRESAQDEEQLLLDNSEVLKLPGRVHFRGPVDFAGGASPTSPFQDCTLSDEIEVIRRRPDVLTYRANVPEVFALTCNGVTVNLSRFRPDRCGDGRITAGEACDCGNSPEIAAQPSTNTRCGGQQNSDSANALCRTDCSPQRCGDGIRDSGEECDDGNEVEDDACTRECEINDRCKGEIDPGEHYLTHSAIVELPLNEGGRNAGNNPSCRGAGPESALRLLLEEESEVLFDVLESSRTGGGSIDTTLELRTHCGLPEAIACDDDGGAGLLSRIELPSLSREDGPLYLVLRSYGGSEYGSAKVAVHVRCADLEPTAVLRDNNFAAAFGGRTDPPVSTSLTFDTSLSGVKYPVMCPLRAPRIGENGSQALIELVLTEQKQVSFAISDMSPGYDSYLLMKESCTSATAISCDDDGNNAVQRYASRIQQVLNPGVYHFVIDGYNGSQGSGTATVTLTCPTDSDGDGLCGADDAQPGDRNRCADTDGDGCDDCQSGTFDPANDGPDPDGDGICNP